MKLEGYTVTDVNPWEAASGGKAVTCGAAKCAASFQFDGKPGWYALRVEYFDQNNGVSHFRLSVRNQIVDEWAAADDLPSRKIDGASSIRREILGIALRPGDEIRIEGIPNSAETAAFDYLEVLASEGGASR